MQEGKKTENIKQERKRKEKRKKKNVLHFFANTHHIINFKNTMQYIIIYGLKCRKEKRKKKKEKRKKKQKGRPAR